MLPAVLVAVDAPHPAAGHPLLPHSPLVLLHLLLRLADLSTKPSRSFLGLFSSPSLLLKFPSQLFEAALEKNSVCDQAVHLDWGNVLKEGKMMNLKGGGGGKCALAGC